MTTATDAIIGLNGFVAYKPPVKVATTANITLSGAQTIDGVSVVADDRVLVKDQTDGTENGIYIASADTWTRARDMNGAKDVISGTQVFVRSGTAGGGKSFYISTSNPITIGTTSLTFTIFNTGGEGGGDLLAANNLSDLANAATARTNLGVAIGSDVQAYDAELAAVAGLTSAANKVPYFTGSGTAGVLDFLDEDAMGSDSATAVASQQSIKAYVDATGGAGAMTFIASSDASTDATLDFTGFAGGSYDAYMFALQNIIPDTDDVELWMRLSNDAGVSYEAGAGYYAHSHQTAVYAAADGGRGSTSDTEISMSDTTASEAVGSGVGEDGWSGVVWVLGPHLTKRSQLLFEGCYESASGTLRQVAGGRATVLTAEANDAIRFLFESGNIESGTITMYGLGNA